MESQHQTSLFSWLYEQACDQFEYQGKPFVRHTEAEAPERTLRVRLVYEVVDLEASLTDSLMSLPSLVSMATIQRPLGLWCVELCLNSPLTEMQRALLSALPKLEVIEMPKQPVRLDLPGLLVMDMDSTAIEIECIDELAKMAGVGEAVAVVTERAMQGELDFEQSLRARVSQLAGADASIIDKLCATLPLMPGLEAMITLLQACQWRLVLASGGFTPFVGHLKDLLGLDAAYANELVIEAGTLKGEVRGTVVDAQFKADTVARCATQWGIKAGQRCAIGDGANDIPMVQMADFGIAFHAKPKLRLAADAAIAHLDLRVLPYMLLDLSEQ